MRRSSKVTLLGSVLLLVSGAVLALAPHAAPTTPEVQITQTLQDAEAAARRGDVPGILEAFSDRFQSGELRKERLRLLLLRARNQSRGVDYDVHVNAPRFLPARADRPDERIALTRFSVFEALGGETLWGTEPLTLVLRQERRRRWLFFTEPCWRVVSIANLPPLPGLVD